MHGLASLFLLLAITVTVANGKVLADLSGLSSEVAYDFIVVGGKLGLPSLPRIADATCRRIEWFRRCQPALREPSPQCPSC